MKSLSLRLGAPDSMAVRKAVAASVSGNLQQTGLILDSFLGDFSLILIKKAAEFGKISKNSFSDTLFFSWQDWIWIQPMN